ncbi:MAG: Bax inhibitor-1/YccA family protein, partial [Kiloniellales bacterium]
MAIGPKRKVMTRAQAQAAAVDVGLRAYMLRVYNYMCVALALSGAVAFVVSTSPAMQQAIFGTPLMWVVFLAPLGLVFFLSARINKMSASAAQTTFWIFAALMGMSLASIFIAYTPESVTRVFFITAGAFAGLSLVGYTTKKDLSG